MGPGFLLNIMIVICLVAHVQTVVLGRGARHFPEHADKVAVVAEAQSIGHLLDWHIGGVEQQLSPFHFFAVDVLQGRWT